MTGKEADDNGEKKSYHGGVRAVAFTDYVVYFGHSDIQKWNKKAIIDAINVCYVPSYC
jgi:hypothetical protein